MSRKRLGFVQPCADFFAGSKRKREKMFVFPASLTTRGEERIIKVAFARWAEPENDGFYSSAAHAAAVGKRSVCFMKILIAGDGKVGSTLTRQLSAEGYDITLIDSDPQVLEACVERYDVMTVCGNCAVKEVLQEAGAGDADLLIAVAETDEVNLLCCMTAHSLNPRLHTIARIRNPEYSDQIYEMRDVFALSMTVNPEKQAALEVERLLRYPGFLRLDTFAKGRVEIVELRIDEDSRLCDVPLPRINEIVKCRILICAVLRGGEVITPAGDFVLRKGDRIFVTAPASNLTVLLNSLGMLKRKVRHVLLCGGGRTSYYLAEHLQKSGISTKLIEIDRERCVQFANLLPETDVVHGDASSLSLLESEGLSGFDAVVSLTGMDELNIIISLYGHSHGVPQIITKLGRVEDSGILNSLPLGSIISPKELCSNSIVRYVRAMRNQTGAAIAVHFIADGKAEAMEFLADAHTKHTGEPLKKLKLHRNVLIACITRGGKTEIPGGDSVFYPGDTLVVVTNGSNKIYQLNDIFE